MKHKSIIFIILLALFFTPVSVFSGEWTWQNPLPQGNALTGVWGSSGSDVFAVGLNGTILHYNGSTWSTMSSGTTETLMAVWGSSGSNVFAVGSGGIILHYDGSTWSLMPNPIYGWEEALTGVWGSSGSDVFAVGFAGIILHYDGSTWSSMPNPVYMQGGLDGVWGSSGSNVFVVGSGGIILHYDGSTWSSMPNPVYMQGDLDGVWGSSGSDVFVVGSGGIILHYDGSTWSTMSSGTTETLMAVWGSSGSNVFAVGSFVIKCTILHYDGSTWSTMSSGIANHLYGVWGSSGSDVFAVGSSGTILHYDGSAWSSMPSGTTNTLYGVWGSSGSDVFAVGVSSTILHYNGSTWSAMPSGTPATLLRSVWGSSGSDVFAVGSGGKIFHYNGSTWSFMPNPAYMQQELYGVWGSSGSDVYAVGDYKIILHYNGSTWSVISKDKYSPPNISSVWGSSSSDVFLLWSAGKILHYNGSTWSFMPNPAYMQQELYGVWGSSGSDVFAVGYDGIILHYDGSTWSSVASGINPSSLKSVWGSSGSDVFAVGVNGTIIHYDGNIRLPVGQQQNLTPSEPKEERWGELTLINGPFDSSRDTYVISHGCNWKDTTAIPLWENDMGNKIKDLPEGANVLLWNWQEQAKGSIPCSWGDYRVGCCPRTKVPYAGKYLAQSIEEKIAESITPADYSKDIHMIGHSLGAMVIVVAAKEMTSDLRDNIQVLTLLDSPLKRTGLFEQDFLEQNTDIFIDNYISQWSENLPVADTNVDLTWYSFMYGDCNSGWYSYDEAGEHGYSYVWYYSSIDNFRDPNIMCDESSPDFTALGGFNFSKNHDNICEDYKQSADFPMWAIIPESVQEEDGDLECLLDGVKYCYEEWSDAQECNSYAYNNGVKITVKKAYTFSSYNDASGFQTNISGNAIYDGQAGAIRLTTHSDAIAYANISIPSDLTSLRFSYEFIDQIPGGVLDVFINNIPVFTAYSEDNYGGRKNSYWIDISTYAGQTVTLTFRLANPNSPEQYSANIDNILIARISSTVDSDGDGVIDDLDNCPSKPNSQTLGTCTSTSDKPGIACTTDADCFNSCSSNGHCSLNQEDNDSDGVGDVCDNCTSVCNPLQSDANGNGIGDLCDPNPGCGGGCAQPACEQECSSSTTTTIL